MGIPMGIPMDTVHALGMWPIMNPTYTLLCYTSHNVTVLYCTFYTYTVILMAAYVYK